MTGSKAAGRRQARQRKPPRTDHPFVDAPSPRRRALWARAAEFGQASPTLRAFIADGRIDAIAAKICADVGISVGTLLQWVEDPGCRRDPMLVETFFDAVCDQVTSIIEALQPRDDRGAIVMAAVAEVSLTAAALRWLFDTASPLGPPSAQWTPCPAH